MSHIPARSEVVVLVHGLWMHGLVFAWMRRRLEQRGYTVRTYSYPSVRRGLMENARDLQRFLQGIKTERIHLVGHSLGGLIVLAMLSRLSHERIGRVVLMGSPCRGSHCAATLTKVPGLSRFVGHSLRDWMTMMPLDPGPLVEVGVISGDLGLGMGRLIPGLPLPNDGLVSVNETLLTQARDAITLRVGHSGMPFSRACAEQVAAFIAEGHFLR